MLSKLFSQDNIASVRGYKKRKQHVCTPERLRAEQRKLSSSLARQHTHKTASALVHARRRGRRTSFPIHSDDVHASSAIMLEPVLSFYLNKYLGKYVTGLDSDKLRVSVWAGDVVLKDLQLRSEALQDLNLPITVKGGVLGTLRLKVVSIFLQAGRLCVVFAVANDTCLSDSMGCTGKAASASRDRSALLAGCSKLPARRPSPRGYAPGRGALGRGQASGGKCSREVVGRQYACPRACSRCRIYKLRARHYQRRSG